MASYMGHERGVLWVAGLPYAWVNLRHGVFSNETEVETNTAACGSFTIEMGVLSRLTGMPFFLDLPRLAVIGCFCRCLSKRHQQGHERHLTTCSPVMDCFTSLSTRGQAPCMFLW